MLRPKFIVICQMKSKEVEGVLQPLCGRVRQDQLRQLQLVSIGDTYSVYCTGSYYLCTIIAFKLLSQIRTLCSSTLVLAPQCRTHCDVCNVVSPMYRAICYENLAINQVTFIACVVMSLLKALPSCKHTDRNDVAKLHGKCWQSMFHQFHFQRQSDQKSVHHGNSQKTVRLGLGEILPKAGMNFRLNARQ